MRQLIPGAGGLNVDFDHTGVGRHTQHRDACIAGGFVAFQNHRQTHGFGRGLNRCDHFQIIFQPLGRRHKDIQLAATRLGTHGRACDAGCRLKHLRLAQGVLWVTGERPAFAICVSLRFGVLCQGAHPDAELLVRRQRRLRHRRIRLVDIGEVTPGDPGLRIQRHPVTQRRIAGEQITAFVA